MPKSTTGHGPTDDELEERAEGKRVQAEEETRMAKYDQPQGNNINPVPNQNAVHAFGHTQVRLRAADETGAEAFGLKLVPDAWVTIDLAADQLNELAGMKGVIVDDGKSPISRVSKKDVNDPSKKIDNTPMDDAKPGVSVSKNLGGPTIAPNDKTGKG